MKLKQIRPEARTAGFVYPAALMLAMALGLSAQPPQGRGGPQAEPAPTGPFAPEKYKNIQVLTTVPAVDMEATMTYVAASTGMTCVSCHVQDASGQFAYEKDDKRSKQTARNMMKMVLGINAANYGVRVECATCHAGHNRPEGLPMAAMLTPEEVSRMNAPQGPGPGGFPGGGFGGRGAQRPAPPPVADIISKYLDAVGGRDAVEKLQSLSLTGALTNRAGQSFGFTIEEKGNKYREAEQSPEATLVGFDGTSGWAQTGAKVSDLTGFGLDEALHGDDLGIVLHLTEKYPTLQVSGRSFPIDGKATTSVVGRDGIVNDQFSFDAASGLLLRRVITTRTPLGQLREEFNYADYRSVGGVKIPFSITRNTWNALDTLKVSDAKANPQLDDALFAKPK